MLSNPDKRAIGAVRLHDVIATLKGLDKFMKNSAWLAQGNRYATDPLARIKADTRNHVAPNARQMGDYIGASCLLHCSDGWSYLGRALLALLRGDPHRAVHFAYYAELRAACSLMATQGVGIFNNAHFVINGQASAAKLAANTGTHVFAWESLAHWSTLNKSGVLFAQCIRPFGLSLENWCGPFGGGGQVSAQAQDWFQQWSMDLRLLPEDRNARNLSSYHPDGLPDSWVLNAGVTVDFVKELWASLEPSATSGFEIIDRHILRISLEGVFKNRVTQQSFSEFLKQTFEVLGRPVDEKQWMNFMTRSEVAEDIQLIKWSKESPGSRSSAHFSIIARAVLLLRVATGATSRAFIDANHTLSDFEFWWKSVGNSRGIYDGDMEGADLQLLWTDVKEHLQELEDYQSSTSVDKQTFFDIGKRLSQTVIGLGSCERVALWSMTS